MLVQVHVLADVCWSVSAVHYTYITAILNPSLYDYQPIRFCDLDDPFK